MARSFREWLMNMTGHYWWPPRSDDPTIKGPQPRIVTRKQYEALMKLRECGEDPDGDVVENQG